MVGEFRNVEQVGQQFRHHDAGAVAVVIAEAQSLVLREQVSAHVRLHVRAHRMAPASDEELTACTHEVQQHEQCQNPAERTKHFRSWP